MVGQVPRNSLHVQNFLFSEPMTQGEMESLVYLTPQPSPPSPLHFYIAPRLIAMSCGVIEDICVSDNMLTVITTRN